MVCMTCLIVWARFADSLDRARFYLSCCEQLNERFN
jgi:hypothetical protein